MKNFQNHKVQMILSITCAKHEIDIFFMYLAIEIFYLLVEIPILIVRPYIRFTAKHIHFMVVFQVTSLESISRRLKHSVSSISPKLGSKKGKLKESGPFGGNLAKTI